MANPLYVASRNVYRREAALKLALALVHNDGAKNDDVAASAMSIAQELVDRLTAAETADAEDE